MTVERIYTDAPIITLWHRLSVLTSINSALDYLRSYPFENKVDDECLRAKAQGIAFCLRSAEDYLQNIEINSTAKALLYYYGLLSLMSVLILSDPSNPVTLDNIENATRRGHGVKNDSRGGLTFPDSEFVYLGEHGFLTFYFQQKNVNVSSLIVKGNPLDSQDKLIFFRDLLARVPELKPIYLTLFKDHPAYVLFDRMYRNQEGSITFQDQT